MPILFSHGEGDAVCAGKGEAHAGAAESKNLCMCRSSKRENRETPPATVGQLGRQVPSPMVRPENATCGNAGMNAGGKSDGSVVPAKPANKDAAGASAEQAEERGPAKRNAGQAALPRTQCRTQSRSRGLLGVREAARKDSKLKFTALLHHVDQDALLLAFNQLKKSAATGVDGVTWQDYGQNVEANLADLHGRIHRGAYRAKPSRRSWIPKPDGRKRPLGIAALEDKVVQQAVATVLQSIYEEDFIGFSYGFRPGKSQHDALDALSVAITSKRVNWILDADIEGFFDRIDHDWLVKFLEHRIGDGRILRLVRKWLRAGVMEDGEWSPTTVGSPQGAVISPLLSNVYLHYVLDLWVKWWRGKHCQGDVVMVRYADDFVIGFQDRGEAERCLCELRGRMAEFGLKLHEGKTRLVEFGRHAAADRGRRGEGKPETFDFLGFTHMCSRTKAHGYFTIHRQTVAKRMRATLAAIKGQLRKRRHRPLAETGRWLGRVVQGWLNYHAVPGNPCPWRFVQEVTWQWLRAIRRRSQKGRSSCTWERLARLREKYLPRVRVVHPYPSDRFRARLKAGAV